MHSLKSVVAFVVLFWQSLTLPFSKERFAAAASAHTDAEAAARMQRWGEPILLAIVAAAALGCVVSGVFAFRAERLLNTGVAARALVETARVERRSAGKSGTVLVRVVTYSFVADDGALHQGSSEANVERLPGVEAGAEIPLRYAADDPTRNVPVSVLRGRIGDLLLMMAMAAAFAGYFGLLLMRIHTLLRERAYAANATWLARKTS